MNRSAQHAFQPEEVMAYLDGELEPKRAAELAAHLDRCDECRMVSAQLRQVSERLLDFEVEPCPAVMEKIVLAALEASEPRAKQVALDATKREPRAWRRLLANRYVWAAACVLILAVAGTTVLRSLVAPTVVIDRMSGEGLTGGDSGTPYVAKVETTQEAEQELARRREEAQVSESLERSPEAAPPAKPSEDTLAAPQPAGPMIAQTASLTITAVDYDAASAALERLATSHGGYVQKLSADAQSGTSRELTATLRVPAKNLDAFLEGLRKLGHVDQESRENEEVTDEYVDLQARLKSAHASEQRLLDLLATRTGKLENVLDAERELARIRGEIESMEGQRIVLAHRVDYATVDVDLREEYREQIHTGSSLTRTKIWNAVVDGVRNLEDEAVSLTVFAFAYGPSILFWLAIIVVPGWFGWRRFRARRESRT